MVRVVSNGINILDCRGQGYDGARSVAVKNQGVAAYVFRLNSMVFYTHYCCHRLILAVAAFCGEQRIRNLMTNSKEIF